MHAAEQTATSLQLESTARLAEENMQLLRILRQSEADVGRDGAESLAQQHGISLAQLEASVAQAHADLGLHSIQDDSMGESEIGPGVFAAASSYMPGMPSKGSIAPGSPMQPLRGTSDAGDGIVQSAIEVDSLVVRAKQELLRGEKMWFASVRQLDRYSAFKELTATLSHLRHAIVKLVRLVRRW